MVDHRTKFKAAAVAACFVLLAVVFLLHTVGWRLLISVALAIFAWAKFLVPPVRPILKNERPQRPAKALLHDHWAPHKLATDAPVDYVIIGAGMAGQSCAAVLARMGFRVVVLEQHDVAGGGAHEYELDGRTFDSGLHYTVAWSGPLLRLCGGPLAKEVPFDRLGDPAAGVFDILHVGDEPPFHIRHGEAHRAALYARFPAPADRAALDAFFRVSDAVLWGTPVYLLSRLLPARAQRWVWRWLLPTFAAYAGQTGLHVLQALTPNKRLQSLLAALWIDTGGRPDTASFFLLAAVFRGLALEGASYPRGGARAMSESLVPAIEAHNGRVFTKARVREIITDEARAVATGVLLADGTEIAVTHGVISTIGYDNTFGKLLPEQVTAQHGIPVPLRPLVAGAGFVMVNCAIKGTAEALGLADNQNHWVHPTDADGGIFGPLQEFFKDPLSAPPAVMITFPSIKDRSNTFVHEAADHVTCQILCMTRYEWFAEWAASVQGDRGVAYTALKTQWADRLLPILYKHCPKVEGRVVSVDVSTPLTIEHYLGAVNGSAVGLDPTPERWNGDWSSTGVMRHLDTVTPVRGLYLAGQDTLVCGVVLAQLSGLLTALRVAGFAHTLKLAARALVHGT